MKRISLILALSITGAGCGADTDEANGYAKTFVKKNFPNAEVQNLDCQNTDSDGNCYVAFTASLNEGGKTRLQGLECAASWPWQFGKWLQTGCRVPKVGQ